MRLHAGQTELLLLAASRQEGPAESFVWKSPGQRNHLLFPSPATWPCPTSPVTHPYLHTIPERDPGSSAWAVEVTHAWEMSPRSWGEVPKHGHQAGSCQQPGNASREPWLGLNLREEAAVSSNRLRVISRHWALIWREIDCKRQ